MRYFLLGEKLSHSYSKIIHRYKGLDYSLKEISKNDLECFIKRKDYAGLNVTIPYKKDVIPFLDKVDSSALSIGAVNTIVNDNGCLVGYNTDVFGMEYMLKRAGINLEGQNVLILGSGGTFNTASYLARSLMAKSIRCVSRTGEINYQNCYDLSDTNVIINASPVGTFPKIYDKSVDLTKFPNLIGVCDCVYNPLNSALIMQAKSLGLMATGGLPMLVAQGLKAEELWLGKKISDREIEEVIAYVEKEKRNIVLIGMPSCGKSTIAKLLSKKTGKPVYDTDALVESLEKTSIPELFSTQGEGYFRDAETKAIKEVSILSGVIIATGGGAVLREENRKALSQNGLIVYLDRPLEKLLSDGRPLSQKNGIKKLFEERKDIYEKFADAKIDCDKEPTIIAEEILKL